MNDDKKRILLLLSMRRDYMASKDASRMDFDAAVTKLRQAYCGDELMALAEARMKVAAIEGQIETIMASEDAMLEMAELKDVLDHKTDEATEVLKDIDGEIKFLAARLDETVKGDGFTAQVKHIWDAELLEADARENPAISQRYRKASVAITANKGKS